MSVETNRKILIGSLSNSLDKRLILGDTFNKDYLNIVLLLVDRIDYAIKQVQKGVTEYESYVKTLTDLLNRFKYQCPNVCVYKDRLIIRGTINTAPTIDNNTIIVSFDEEVHSLPFLEVVYNFNDTENDFISEVVILTEDSEHNLFLSNSDVIINYEYSLPTSFSISFKKDSTKEYLIKNLDTEPCTAEIVTVDKTLFDTNIIDSEVVEIDSISNKTVFQKFVTETVTLPNDTIIYVHIDTTSMNPADQTTIKDSVIAWYTQFKIDNPSFAGSLLINTTDNQDIDDDYAVGRSGGGNGGGVSLTGYVKITNSNIKIYENETLNSEPQEYWLQSPAEGLLRQAWKEGNNDFADEASFFDYIQGKSLVTLSFVDESNAAYHSNYPTFDGPTPQASSLYITDYNNFITKIRPYLTFFKGILYPVTNPTSSLNRAFLLQAISAIEARVILSQELNSILGQDKVAAIGNDNMLALYILFASNSNPYLNYTGLKEAGWKGNFTKLAAESGGSFDETEFSAELDELLTSTEDIQVTTIQKTEIDSTNLGSYIETEFTLKVRDNNVYPLFSNTATITIQHVQNCDTVPDCSKILQKVIGDVTSYTITSQDLSLEDDVDKIKIENILIPEGSLLYNNVGIISSILPIVVSKEDIDAGKLVYIPNINNTEEYSALIDYSESLIGSINYCFDTDRLQLDKNENQNQAPIVIAYGDLLYINPGDLGSLTVHADVIYTGTGGYTITWSQISGTEAILDDIHSEDLSVSGLTAGTYEFQISVITDVNNFVITDTATITVEENILDKIIFGGSATELAPTSTDLEATAVITALQQTLEYDSPILITCTEDNNNVNNFTYVVFKDAVGTVSSIYQSNFGFDIIGAFEDLGTFTYDDGFGDDTWRIFKTNDPGAFASSLVLTITFI